MTTNFRLMGAFLLATMSFVAAASAESIGVNFSCGYTITTNNGSSTWAQSDTNMYPLASTNAAGVASQTYWNNSGTHSGNTSNIVSPTSGVLIDSNGNATGTTISWTSNNAWATSSSTQSNANKQLMNGYIDTKEQITVSNISYGTYDVYVYVGSDVSGRTGHGYLVTTSGNTTSSVYFKTYSASFDGTTWVQGTGTDASTANSAEYILFQNATGSSFTYYEAGDSGNVGVCAIQIVSTVPEPASTVLMLMGAGGLLACDWRKRRKN
jgi:hypothetical protein